MPRMLQLSVDVLITQCHNIRGSVSHHEVLTRWHQPVPFNQRSDNKTKLECIGALQGIFFFSWSFYKFFLRGPRTSCVHTLPTPPPKPAPHIYAQRVRPPLSHYVNGVPKKKTKNLSGLRMSEGPEEKQLNTPAGSVSHSGSPLLANECFSCKHGFNKTPPRLHAPISRVPLSGAASWQKQMSLSAENYVPGGFTTGTRQAGHFWPQEAECAAVWDCPRQLYLELCLHLNSSVRKANLKHLSQKN